MAPRPRPPVSAVLAVAVAGFLVASVALGVSRWDPTIDTPAAPLALGNNPQLTAATAVEPTAFYDPPSPLPDGNPGTVLRTEVIEDAPDTVRAWRMLYLSNDNNDNPIAVSGYYVEPATPPESVERFPLIGMAHGTTGISRACGMSQAPFTPTTPGFEYWETIVRPLTDAGYAVAVTDYEGMGAPGTATYLILKAQAYDVLDSLRAAINFRPDRLDANSLGIVGHSEGGFAALAAAQAVADYAPDLAVRGAVSLAPGLIPPLPFAISATVKSTGDGPSPRSGYLAVLGTSWADTYPDLLSPEKIYTPEGVTTVAEAVKTCTGTMNSFFTGPLTDYVQSDPAPEMVTVAALNMPVNGVSRVPILIQQGSRDESVVPQLSHSLVAQLCTQGATVSYQAFPDDVHRSVQWTGRQLYLDWLADRMDGVPAPRDCGGVR